MDYPGYAPLNTVDPLVVDPLVADPLYADPVVYDAPLYTAAPLYGDALAWDTPLYTAGWEYTTPYVDDWSVNTGLTECTNEVTESCHEIHVAEEEKKSACKAHDAEYKAIDDRYLSIKANIEAEVLAATEHDQDEHDAAAAELAAAKRAAAAAVDEATRLYEARIKAGDRGLMEVKSAAQLELDDAYKASLAAKHHADEVQAAADAKADAAIAAAEKAAANKKAAEVKNAEAKRAAEAKAKEAAAKAAATAEAKRAAW